MERVEVIDIEDYREEWGGWVGQEGEEMNRLAGKLKDIFIFITKRKRNLSGINIMA